MKATTIRISTPLLVALVPAGLLYLWLIAGVLPRWTALPALLLVVAAGVLVLRSSLPGGKKALLAAYLTLAFFAALAGWKADGEGAGWEDDLKAREAARLHAAIGQVAQRVRRLEEVSSEAGKRVAGFLSSTPRASKGGIGWRIEAFRFFSALAEEVGGGGELPPGTEIGLQLLDDEGGRVAWGGWSQALSLQDRSLIAMGREMVYSRQVSLYRVLTHVIPIGAGGEWTLVVDLPLEVNYKVNNKFIKGTSVAAQVARSFSVSVDLAYLPPQPAPDVPDRRQRRGQPGKLLDRTTRIRENASGGITGTARVLTSRGVPLLKVTVSTPPLAHYSETRRKRFRLLGQGAVLLSLLPLFLVAFELIPSPWPAVRMAALILFSGFLRYSLLSFETAVPGGRWKVFDPVIFATPALKGLMRSPGDLLITAVFLVATLYILLKLARSVSAHAGGGGGRHRSLSVAKGVAAAGLLLALYYTLRAFVATLVSNANPRLIGETVDYLDGQILVLHLGAFLVLSGLVMVYLVSVWGLNRLGGSPHTYLLCPCAAAVLLGLVPFLGWEFGLLGALLILFAFLAPRIVHREDLVSLVIAAFYFVAVVSLGAYVLFNEDYQKLKRIFVQEKAVELASPADNWKGFIVEDVVDKLVGNPSLRMKLSAGTPAAKRRLAFDIWAESSLSLLGYSCALYVLDGRDSLLSRFAVDMPFRADISGGKERIDVPARRKQVVLDLTKNTPQGAVKYYRGIGLIEEFVEEEGGMSRQVLGRVVVDVPYFFENLGWASRTGPRTPEVLRNVQEGGVEPRLEEPGGILLARLDGARVVESSTDDLPPGTPLPAEDLEAAKKGGWPLLTAGSTDYRYLVSGNLLAGYKVPSPLWHLLRWSTILSLYLFFTFVLIAGMVVAKRVPGLGELMPTLTPGRRLGFQQKLLLSFLVVAIVPAILIGVFSSNMLRARFLEENRRKAFNRALSAERALHHMLERELELLPVDSLAAAALKAAASSHERSPRQSESIVSTEGSAAFPPEARVTALSGLGEGRLALLIPEESLSSYPVGRVSLLERNRLYVGLYSDPFMLEAEEGPRSYVLYYGRRLDGDLLGLVADQVGSDIVAYRNGEMVASSSEGLLAAGFMNKLMNPEAFLRVSLIGGQHALTTERAGRYRYQVAYLPLDDHPVNAALALPLLFRPESFHAEVQRATSMVLGIFALLFAATAALGLLLARGIFEPLKSLIEGTRRISKGEFSFKLPFKGEDEIGSVVRAFNEMTDQLERSQRALEQRRRYLEAILASVGTGVISTDEDNQLTTVNAAAERILSVPARALVGKTAGEIAAGGIVPEFFGALQKAASSNEPFVASEVGVRLQGKQATVKFMATKLTFGGGYLGSVFVFEDITELIRSKKLAAWVEMARQIAHEIKNPLTPIKISTQFMRRAFREGSKDFPRILEESSETIIQQVEVLKKIAGEFSSFGKMRELELCRHPLVPLLEEIVAPYRKNSSQVEVSFSTSCPNIKVLVDPEALRKICTNLIENALEAMPAGGRLHIECSEAEHGGRVVEVTFRDTGPGLSDEVRERLFEPYFSTKTQGTGLGLAICRTLSREMGGDVTLENLPDRSGAVATLRLRVEEG